MSVLPERETREGIFAAALSHEMKTPLAALQAATANLEKSLPSLLESVTRLPERASLLEALEPALLSALSHPASDPPDTGLAAREKIMAISRRIRAAGLPGNAEESAEILVRGGWESRYEAIEPILSRFGPEAVLPILEAAGRIRASLRSLEGSVARLSGLVTSLRVGVGAAETTIASFGVRRQIEEAVAILEHSSSPAGEIDVICDPGLSMVGSPTQIQQVVTNLLRNACAALGPEGGRVVVEAAADGGDVVLSVTDDGAGIPEAVKPRLFTPFFTTRPAGQGTGLGLFISRRILENHGGTLTFTSQPGRTCFTARVPRRGPTPPGSRG